MVTIKRGFGLVLCLLVSTMVSANTAYKVAMEADDIVSRVLFDAIAERYDMKVEYVNYPSFNAILNSVKTGESDFAANVTYTDSRANSFDFTSPTNIEYTYLYSKKNASLENVHRVGVPKGTIYAELINANFPHIELVDYAGHLEARSLLEDGKVDGIVDAINQLKPMLLAGFDAQLLNDTISIKPVSIVAPKGIHQSLLKRIETYVHGSEVQKRLRESVKTYQFELRQQALRQTVIDYGLNVDQSIKVKLHNVGQYATYHEDGSYSGISADVMLQACRILLLHCNVVSEADETWQSMYQDLVEQKIDILGPLVISEARKKLFYFSDPYYFPEAIMIKREGYKEGVYSSVSELLAERIGVMQGDFFQDLLSQLLPNKELHAYMSPDELFEAVLNEEIDFLAVSRANFNNHLRASDNVLPLVEDALIGPFYRSNIAIGFAKNPKGEQLATLFSRAIKMIDTQKIIERYDYQPDWKATLQTEQEFSKQSQILLMIVIGFMAVVTMYLHSQSLTDNLTLLKNRRAMNRHYRSGVRGHDTLIYLDVNKFKQINDNHGHDVGDQVLKLIANHIQAHWKGNSYRIGGDEFVLVGKVGKNQLTRFKQQLSKITYQSKDRKLSFPISVALGICLPRRTFMSLQEVLNLADEAMYLDKQSSKQEWLEQNAGKVVRIDQ